MNSITKTVLGTAAATVTFGLFSTPATAEEAVFKLQTTDRAMYGTRQVDDGQFGAGADRLEHMLSLAGSSRSLRQPALNDLCVAYTMLRDFEAAETRCNESVENGRSTGLALNNRGVMRIATGDYDGGVQDFAAALEEGGARTAASANLLRAQQRVAELRADDSRERTADANEASDADGIDG